MSDYLILSLPEGDLEVDRVAHAADAVSRTLVYEGSCLYFPVKYGGRSEVLLTLDKRNSTDSETEWFLRHLAGYLEADLLDSERLPYFGESEDNDLSFLDTLPPPEDEFFPIRLFFVINGLPAEDFSRKISEFFTNNDYDITAESDGFAVYLAFCAYLDIFYLAGDIRVSGEIDLNCAGAGVYAEVVEIGENLVEYLGGSIEFTENPSVSYARDKDFDKLRRDFYKPMAQQLAFAINDNREGLQPLLGWPVDGFEPKLMLDTLVTPLGRYDIETLLSEIKRFGFSYVCDHRFLSRNTPRDSADFYIKEGLYIIWSSAFGGKSSNFHILDYFAMKQCIGAFENALSSDKYAKFPKEIYRWLALNLRHNELDFSKCADYRLHFPPGYMQDEVFYGFGHYLRRLKLPGWLCREEAVHGEDVFLFGDVSGGFRLECEISYGCSGEEVSCLGNNFAHGCTDDIEIFDIGGSSLVRFLDGGFEKGFYRAEAEIYILDEIYRFAVASENHEDILNFRDSIRLSISVEDWYDEVIREESVDPHAPGATFCANIVMPKCRAFERQFPSVPERFIKAPLDIYKIFPDMPDPFFSSDAGEVSSADKKDIIKKILDQLYGDEKSE